MKNSKILTSVIAAIALGGSVLFASPTEPNGKDKPALTGKEFEQAQTRAAANFISALRFCQAAAAATKQNTAEAATLGCDVMVDRAMQDMRRLGMDARSRAEREAFARTLAVEAKTKAPISGRFEFKFDDGQK